MKNKNEINFENWKLTYSSEGKFLSIWYKDNLLIDEIILFNKNNNIDNSIKKTLKNNYLREIPINFSKVKKIASFNHSSKKKFSLRETQKFSYFTGDISLSLFLEVRKEFILISFKIKTNQDYYNTISPLISLGNQMSSIFNVEKRKKTIIKKKIDSLKTSHLQKNMPLLINFFKNNSGTSFLLKTSMPKIYINNNILEFRPVSEGSNKNIVRSWRLKSKISYNISFLLQKNEKKGEKIIK